MHLRRGAIELRDRWSAGNKEAEMQRDVKRTWCIVIPGWARSSGFVPSALGDVDSTRSNPTFLAA